MNFIEFDIKFFIDENMNKLIENRDGNLSTYNMIYIVSKY